LEIGVVEQEGLVEIGIGLEVGLDLGVARFVGYGWEKGARGRGFDGRCGRFRRCGFGWGFGLGFGWGWGCGFGWGFGWGFGFGWCCGFGRGWCCGFGFGFGRGCVLDR